ncbi:hypothetical protein D5086_016144 [Populus alba]|uniref:Uncharacterized protein n=1 Tax=Populus alba TaxID=43335 RepID=A0ACC4BUK6_POPAL
MMECLKAKEGESHSQLPHPEEPHVPAPPSLELVLMDSMLYQVLGYSQFPTPFSRRMLSLILLFCSSSSMLSLGMLAYVSAVEFRLLLFWLVVFGGVGAVDGVGFHEDVCSFELGRITYYFKLIHFLLLWSRSFPHVVQFHERQKPVLQGLTHLLRYKHHHLWINGRFRLPHMSQYPRQNSDRDQHRGCGTNNPLFWIRDGFYRYIYTSNQTNRKTSLKLKDGAIKAY